MASFDYIIIGAGSAGCVLADRLSSSGKFRVLLVEAGPSDDRFWVRTPIGYGMLFDDSRVNWRYHTNAETGLDNRQLYWPRGKVLGGSSSINALVYHHGQPADYDDWAAAGNSGWDYHSIKPIYNSFEDIIRNDDQRPMIGKLTVSDVADEYHPLKSHFFSMANEMGLHNDAACRLDGEGLYPYFITTRRGVRCSSSKAFLHPAASRPNLTVMTDCMATRIEVRDGRAIAVHLMQQGAPVRLAADGEIIISAGAVNSPQLLQLSGIGPGAVSQRNGIDVMLDQPNVGLHLSDHLGVNYYQRASCATLNSVFGSWPRIGLAGLQYLFTKKGPLSLGVNQLGGLLRARADAPRPDTQIYINPITYRPPPPGGRRPFLPDREPGFIFSFNSCRPFSTGRIEINTPDWRQPPLIFGNYLSDPRDLDDVIHMARLVGRMQDSAAVGQILAAPPETPLSRLSDDAIIDDFRARSGTVYHPCGTCRMGPDAAHAVVDPALRVHGIDRLRIADASVFPNITSANLNAPTIMLAHKAAQLVLQDRQG